MIMWIRVAGALALTWGALAALDYLGLGGRSGDDAVRHGASPTWSRDLFWFAILWVVMATALLAAARRAGGNLRRALAKA